MTILKAGEKELKIKYGYEATLKTRILTKLSKMSESMKTTAEAEDSTSKAEDMLLFIPEFLLVGLQKHHSEEYGFNYKTEQGKEEALNKVYELLDDYFEDENNDITSLFNQLQNEMFENGFLAKMFRNEIANAEQNLNIN